MLMSLRTIESLDEEKGEEIELPFMKISAESVKTGILNSLAALSQVDDKDGFGPVKAFEDVVNSIMSKNLQDELMQNIDYLDERFDELYQ